jgi:type II secretory pathway pseudopilin PulG
MSIAIIFKKNKFSQAGFTLIEIIIYIALFSFILVTAFVAAFQLIDGSSKLSVKNNTESEANFVMQKINWVMTGIDPTTTPVVSGSGCNQNLSIHRTDTSMSPVVIRSNIVSGVNYIEIQKNGGTFYPITTANVLVTCLKFVPISGSPFGINTTFTMNNTDFNITKYIRK